MAWSDFEDLAQRAAAYRGELRAFALPWRLAGIAPIRGGVDVTLVRGDALIRCRWRWLPPAGYCSSA